MHAYMLAYHLFGFFVPAQPLLELKKLIHKCNFNIIFGVMFLYDLEHEKIFLLVCYIV